MNSKIDQTLKQMFGTKEYYTALERREASSVHLFPETVGSLMHLIHRTEAQGKRDCTIRDADMMKAESYLCALLS